MSNKKLIENVVYLAECYLSMVLIKIMERRHVDHLVPQDSCVYCQVKTQFEKMQYQAQNSPYPTQFIEVSMPHVEGWN